MNIQLDDFERAYFECALWTAELDAHSVEEIDERHIENSRKEIAAFRETEACKDAIEKGFWTEDQAGHDFWLTRNHHGAGFWDRHSSGEGRALGEKLTEQAHKYCEIHLFKDDYAGSIKIGIE
jgi:hypothetical protein